MSFSLKRHLISVATITTFFVLITGKLSLQSDAYKELPANGCQQTYGFGWDCERGFKKPTTSGMFGLTS
jgi:hypothetical protein